MGPTLYWDFLSTDLDITREYSMSGRYFNQKCEKCGEFFVTPVTDPKIMCDKCIIVQKVKEKFVQLITRQLITRHPYMAYGREMLILLDEIQTKLKSLYLIYTDNPNHPFTDYFKSELNHIKNIKEKCHYQI